MTADKSSQMSSQKLLKRLVFKSQLKGILIHYSTFMMSMEAVVFHTKNLLPHFLTNQQPRVVQVPDQADHKAVAAETQKLSLKC
jgi:hypothetical protein